MSWIRVVLLNQLPLINAKNPGSLFLTPFIYKMTIGSPCGLAPPIWGSEISITVMLVYLKADDGANWKRTAVVITAVE